MSDQLATSATATALANLPDLGVAKFGDDQDFGGMVKSAFLSRVQLMAGSSGMVAEGKMGVNKYAFIRNKEDFVDLGDTFDCIPLLRRFVALRFLEGNKVESHYDPKSPEFKAVQVESEEPDSGCSYGPQYLIWVPKLREFASFLFGSKSARPEARKMEARLKSGVTMRGKIASSDKYKWPVPVVLPCQAELEPPPVEQYTAIGEKFLNPGPSEVSAEFAPAAAPGQEAAAAGGRVV